MSFLKNHHAILIGVGTEDIKQSATDARAVYKILINEEIGGYLEENVTLLTKKNASKEGIIKAMSALKSRTNKDSTVLFYYSGHGAYFAHQPDYFFQLWGWSVENHETHSFYDHEFKQSYKDLNQKKLIILLDCCHAAAMTNDENDIIESKNLLKRLSHADGLAQKIDTGKGECIISSCKKNQLSYIIPGENHSLFTKYLIEALKGKHKSAFEDEFINIWEVRNYVSQKVKEVAEEFEIEQTPYSNLPIYSDFIVSNLPKKLRNKVIKSDVNFVQKIEQNQEGEVIQEFRKVATNNNLVLFVHGFTGEAAKTFGNIPAYLMEDEEMDGWDLMPFGFSQYIQPTLGKQIWASTDDIDRIAEYLRASITYSFESYKRIAIIAHSLGGLVTQRAILDLEKNDLDRVSHLLLFGAPNNGIDGSLLTSSWKKMGIDLSNDDLFIKTLRLDWDETFNNSYPFDFKVITATHDEFVSKESSQKPFSQENCFMVNANHFDMVKPKDKNNDSYVLIRNSLSNDNYTFLNQFSSEEEINLAVGEYEAVVKKLLPNKNKLNQSEFKQLIYALEALDRDKEVLKLLKHHKLYKENSELLEILGNHYKKAYFHSNSKRDLNKSFEYFLMALKLAEEKEANKEIYSIAKNLAFLCLLKIDSKKTGKYANQALLEIEKDATISLKKMEAIAEANLFLGNIKIAEKYYEEISKMEDLQITDKIKIHENAVRAYACLDIKNAENKFIQFLMKNFLN